ncbi:MAG: complex I subunit 5 family protein [Gammaproteobacteria bacterium]|nr:complex I subunit 5 family protein [Gammaproteobacteria bacterium]
MNAAMLLLIWLLPLLLAALSGQRYARWLTVIAVLPALIAALTVPIGTTVSLPWLLLGVELGLDKTGRLFLLFSSLLWLAASLFAIGSPKGNIDSTRFRVFFLLAMAGNLGLIVAQDMLSFYLGFTLMGLAAYGLVAHPASLRARRAARRYLAWTIAGELILFSAIVILAQQSGGLSFQMLKTTTPSDLVVLLLIVGFGIKLALPGLHLWLPQAYAVAPAPAVAVLSGAMIKAGLLGWLRFLPPGDAALIGWGEVLMVVGVIGIFFGAINGLLQRHPRLLLGYSSISKMGVLTLGIGAAWAWPAAAPALISALVIYAAHHALVKGALFLGLGLVERGGLRPWIWAGLGFLALALAGAPLTSGALAKSMLTTSLPDQAHSLLTVLGVAAFTTVALMARLLYLLWQQPAKPVAPHAMLSMLAWLLLLALIALVPFTQADASQLFSGGVALLLGLIAAALVVQNKQRLPELAKAQGRSPKARRYLRARWHRIVLLMRAMQTRSRTLGSTRRVIENSMHDALQPGQQLQSKKGTDSWPLIGSLWLGIGALLLGALMMMT